MRQRNREKQGETDRRKKTEKQKDRQAKRQTDRETLRQRDIVNNWILTSCQPYSHLRTRKNCVFCIYKWPYTHFVQNKQKTHSRLSSQHFNIHTGTGISTHTHTHTHARARLLADRHFLKTNALLH